VSTRFSIEAIFRGIDKFSAPVARMTTAMDRFTRRVRKGMTGISRLTKRMARGFRNSALTLGSLAVMGGYALKGLFGPATRFQHAMDGVNAVTLGAYTEHMPALSRAALELGKKTTFTATQVANAMEILAKSGLSANETLGLIEPTLLGAEAAGSDISTMADILVSTVAQMKELDAMRDGERVINAYAVAASSANTTIEELGEGMKKTIPVGEGLNFAFEDMLATTTLLQHMGIEASMTGSQQRTFFTRLASMTPKAAKSFRGMGIEILDANKDMKKIPELLAAIAAGFKKVKGNAPRLKKMAEAVGLRGGIAGNILVRNMDQLESLLLKISTLKEGAAGKMAGMRLDNLQGDLVRLKSAWEFFRISIATGSLPELRDLVQSLTSWLTDTGTIDAAAKQVKESVTSIMGFWNSNKSDIIDLAATSLKTVQVLAGIVAVLGKGLGWAWDWAEGYNNTLIARWLNSAFSEEWRDYYKRQDTDTSTGIRGLPSDLTQHPVVTQAGLVTGEIIIRNETGHQVAIVNDSRGIPLRLGSGSGDFGESNHGLTWNMFPEGP